MRKTPTGAEGVAPAPLTWGVKKRADTLDMTNSADSPWKFGTLTRPANAGILERCHHNAYDFSVLGNTPVFFPIGWARADRWSPERDLFSKCFRPFVAS